MTPDERYSAMLALHGGAVPLVVPNAWDHASAAALAAAGFPLVATTSLGVAAAAGKPDAAGATEAETLALAAAMARLRCLVSVDIEGGFRTDPAGVAVVVGRLADGGVAGINIEDGRADGMLAPLDEQTALIRAIKERVPTVFVNARTDTYWLAGDRPGSLDETARRAAAFVAAGADCVFVPGLGAAAEIAELAARLGGTPLNVLAGAGGHTSSELGALGVRRVSTGSLLFRAALHAAVTTAAAVRDGDSLAGAGLPSYADVVALTGP